MGKQGPCCHCGVTSTPLWRNGPPDKPVLCNACGSRWRTKGSLTGYTPLHAREAVDSGELMVTKLKGQSFKPKEQKPPKKKQTYSIPRSEPYSDQNYRKIVEADTSNRSSSGSAISYSESYALHGTADASDLTGSSQSNAWDALVPSKKRTHVLCPKPSPVEKLTKELHLIMHEQSSYLLGSSEEDLLYQSENPMDSFEIGYGSVLIRHPNLKLVEEESEVSSVSVDNKSHVPSEEHSGPASYPVNSESKGTSHSNAADENLKKPVAQVAQNNAKRDKLHEKIEILQDADSPLASVDLKEKEFKLGGGKESERVPKFHANSTFASIKRPRDGQNHTRTDPKGTMRSPKRASKPGGVDVCSSGATSDIVESECGVGDDDLLLDVPHNVSFPEGELLRHPPSKSTSERGF